MTAQIDWPAAERLAIAVVRRSFPSPPAPLDRDDLVQIGLLALWRAGGTAEGWTGDPGLAWTILHRRMIDAVRAALGREAAPRTVGPLTWIRAGAESAALAADCWLDRRAQLAALPDQDRRLVVLAAAGLRTDEMAAAVGVTPSRVSQRLTATRARLARATDGGGDDAHGRDR